MNLPNFLVLTHKPLFFRVILIAWLYLPSNTKFYHYLPLMAFLPPASGKTTALNHSF
jgi:hypothetical protein